MRHAREDNIDYEQPDDCDIDMCLSCGRYYGFTQSLADYWREHYQPKASEIMPQLCFKCMEVGQ
jgi:hypothetical protein